MNLDTTQDVQSTSESKSAHQSAHGGWFREQRERVRARGNILIDWQPIKIEGETISTTVIRERRGDFDDKDLLPGYQCVHQALRP